MSAKRNTALSRVIAFTALVAAFLVLIVVVSGSLGGGSDEPHKRHHSSQAKANRKPEKNIPATYVIKSGDTLISIAHETGVSVHQIETLNPAVDPQILIAGQSLKLK